MDFKKGLLIGLGVIAALLIACCGFGGCGLLFAGRVGNEMRDQQKRDIQKTREETARLNAETERLKQ